MLYLVKLLLLLVWTLAKSGDGSGATKDGEALDELLNVTSEVLTTGQPPYVDPCNMPATCDWPLQIVPDSSNCSCFYQCGAFSGHGWYHYICAPGTVFDSVKLCCDYPHLAKCQECLEPTTGVTWTADESTPEHTSSTSEAEVTSASGHAEVTITSDQFTTQLITPFTATDPCRLPPACVPAGERVADTTDCTRYYECPREGEPWISGACTGGLWFDSLRLTCTEMEEVTCAESCLDPTSQPNASKGLGGNVGWIIWCTLLARTCR